MPLDLFLKTPIAEDLPDELRKTVEEIKISSGPEEALKKAYGVLAAKYRGHRFKTYTKLFEVFK